MTAAVSRIWPVRSRPEGDRQVSFYDRAMSPRERSLAEGAGCGMSAVLHFGWNYQIVAAKRSAATIG
jgi:hypothetical protein